MSFDKDYFHTNSYKDVSFARYSQYWWSNRFFAALARRYGRHGSALLEIGTGLGHLAAQLEQDFATYGLDVNPWALKSANEVVTNTHLLLGTAQELPFRDKSIGLVIAKHVVEHLEDPTKAIHEIGRVLEPGGILILATPNLDSFGRRVKGEKWIGYSDPTHIALKTPAEWLDAIKSSNFIPLRQFSDGFWDSPYVPLIPSWIQKPVAGSLGGIQAITTRPFLPVRLGESLIVIGRVE